ncbi:MAG: putative porin, partial [Planctomycetes bacterium]|nr:putative porin [Planctomycetota bacterium]
APPEQAAPGKTIKRLAELADKLSFSGDLTFRWNSTWRHIPPGTQPDRHRQQVRFRLGGEYQFNDRTVIGARLVTGAGDPTSNWQTFTNTFSGKNIFIDRVYVEYTVADWLKLTGGKFNNPFRHTDLIWDSDVQPEGLTERLSIRASDDVSLFANLGQLIIGELNNDYNDQFLYAAQAGWKWKLNPKLQWVCSTTYYDYSNLSRAALTWNDTGNTRLAGNVLRYDFNLFALYTELVSNRWAKPLKFYTEYVNNTSGAPRNEGCKIGGKIGSNETTGDWSAGYAYRLLQANAVPDMLTDGTFHGGGTNTKGHEADVTYSIRPKWTVSVKGIIAKEDKGATNEQNSLLAVMTWEF